MSETRTQFNLWIDNAIALAIDLDFSEVYAIMRDTVDGFPDVYQFIKEAAYLFTTVEPDRGDTFDWVIAMEDYAAELTDHVAKHKKFPFPEEAKAMASGAIQRSKHEEEKGSHPWSEVPIL